MRRIAGCCIVRCCVLLIAGLAEAGVLVGQTTDSVLTEQTRLRAAAVMEQARQVLPQLDGRVSIRGLEQPVEILRDRWGIAHIYAQNSHDLFLAQGYSMALDRLFQIDLWRRISRGETAELFGEESLAADRFARLLKFRGDPQAEWDSYSADTRDIAVAFTDGINACIDAHQDRLPIEFQLAGYRPQHWQPEDILGRMSGIIMSGNWEKEVARTLLIQAVGIEKARMLAPTDPPTEYAPAADVDLSVISNEILSGVRAATRVLKFSPAATESNNWVVSGALSESGKPLLASDPHRSTTLPSLRYLVHLNAPGWNVIGSGEPALPGVALGHNDRIAWGFTIVGTDQADLFIEQTHPDDPRRYRVGDTWETMQTELSSIVVRGRSEPLVVELRWTRHGPVVFQDEQRQLAVSLKWAGSEPGGAAYLASLAVGRAQNQEQFLAALARWKIPCLNFVYADVDGQTGWVAAAATPVRRQGHGLLPVSGQPSAAGWERYLTAPEWPQSFNPVSGWLATANHNILPDGYPHHIARDWSAPYRFQRIESRLTERTPLTLMDFQSIQHDSGSIPGGVLQSIVRTVRFPEPLHPWVALFLNWDCQLTPESQAGPLYAAWMQELTAVMYARHVPMPESTDRGDLRSIQVVLRNLQSPTSAWFGDNAESQRDELLINALSRAVERVQQRLGSDASRWQWGHVHQAVFHHPLESLGPEYAAAFNPPPVPRGGDANTPLNTRHNREFEQIHGATYRHVLDLADWDRGLATSAPGQSGQPGSVHYADLLPLWAEGRYFPLTFSRSRVDEVTQHRLLLTPMSE